MKAQVLITLHEWEPAIEAAKRAIKIEPKWWSAYQTLGRAHLGFGQLQDAVFVSFRYFGRNNYMDIRIHPMLELSQ